MIAPSPRAFPSLLDAARQYSGKGWAVFPLAARRKFPIISKEEGGRGHLDATTDAATVRGWWTRWPLANIGVATGEPSGIDALDVDPKNGGTASLATLVEEQGALPPTLTADTGSGGTHLVFNHAPGVRRTIGFRPGLDYLGDGGYVVVAPSVHPCGRPYRWRPGVTTIADAPAWLVAVVRDARAPKTPSTRYRSLAIPAGVATGYGRVALNRARLAVAQAETGKRNRALNATAYSLGRLVAAGHLAREDVDAGLLAAAVDNGYLGEVGEDAVRGVIGSGMDAGIKAGPRGPTLPWATRRPA